jgi:hypothetical protein
MEVRNNHKKMIIFSVPNDSKDKKEAIRKKATGLLAGVSDLILLVNGCCIFIEIKTEEGKQSENQKIFQMQVETQGFKYIIIRSLEDFKKILEQIKFS